MKIDLADIKCTKAVKESENGHLSIFINDTFFQINNMLEIRHSCPLFKDCNIVNINHKNYVLLQYFQVYREKKQICIEFQFLDILTLSYR